MQVRGINPSSPRVNSRNGYRHKNTWNILVQPTLGIQFTAGGTTVMRQTSVPQCLRELGFTRERHWRRFARTRGIRCEALLLRWRGRWRLLSKAALSWRWSWWRCWRCWGCRRPSITIHSIGDTVLLVESVRCAQARCSLLTVSLTEVVGRGCCVSHV